MKAPAQAWAAAPDENGFAGVPRPRVDRRAGRIGGAATAPATAVAFIVPLPLNAAHDPGEMLMAGLNRALMRPLSVTKRLILPSGPQIRTVWGGLFKGIKLEIDFRTQTQLFLGLYETEIFAFCRTATARSRWMIDVGAGAGELAFYFMRVNGPGTVFGFEPRDAAREVFARNLAANGWSAQDVALSGAFVGTARDAVALDSVAVDRSQHGFLKIDVDGAETDVLHSAAALLQSRAVDVLIEVHSQALEDACISILRAGGYAVTIVDNAWWRLFVPERRPIEHNRWITAVPA